MIWTCIQEKARAFGIGTALIAVGAIGQSIHDGSAKLPWLHQQAASVAPLKAKVAVLVKDEKCQHIRADAATATAKASEAGHDVNLNALPTCPPDAHH